MMQADRRDDSFDEDPLASDQDSSDDYDPIPEAAPTHLRWVAITAVILLFVMLIGYVWWR